MNRLPGWEANSWGYHGDDGLVFASEGEGKPFGPVYTSGLITPCLCAEVDAEQNQVETSLVVEWILVRDGCFTLGEVACLVCF